MKTVLITGASRGLGRALALYFFASGWRVIANARTSTTLMELRDLGIECVPGSVGIAGVRRTLADSIGDRLDVLINNAGVRPEGSFLHAADADVTQTVFTNLIVPMLLTKKVWHALKQSAGMVININSLAGKQGGADEVAYSASKFGLRGFAEALQYDAVKDGVSVLSVFAGAMKTGMTKNRGNYDKLIDPVEVARLIHQATEVHPSLRMTEINVQRSQY
jgi:short-subunit dehydrogenase